MKGCFAIVYKVATEPIFSHLFAVRFIVTPWVKDVKHSLLFLYNHNDFRKKNSGGAAGV